MSNQSPNITRISWGEIEAEEVGLVRDLKLWPGGGRAWDWRETNTHHVPGIQIADIEELLNHGSEVVVLTRGMQFVLQTAPETLDYLDANDIAYHVLETNEAVELYNSLANAGTKVGGLFHSTC